MAAIRTSGWAPQTFAEVVAKLDGLAMRTALRVGETRACPSPLWDPLTTYRVALAGSVPQIQRLSGGKWEAAPLEPPYVPYPDDAKAPAVSTTRLFVSHCSGDAELATV
jgi:hypothetical protein